MKRPTQCRSITAQQFVNRMTLRNAMLCNGFRPVSSEWWHFMLKDGPFPNTYFDMFGCWGGKVFGRLGELVS